MSDFSWSPEKGMQVQYAPRVNRTLFGDGYSQRTGDGLNINPQGWENLIFKYADESELDKIEAFFELKGAIDSFTWTPPGKPEGKYLCTEWNRIYIDTDMTTITAKFEQVFE